MRIHNILPQMTDFEQFIIDNEYSDTSVLLLSKTKDNGIDINLAVNTIEGRKKLKNKLPQWYKNPSIVYPDRLSVEQCSSGETAEYKADVAKSIIGGKGKIADITGGLGVDTWAFSHIASEVLYNEQNTKLYEAVCKNFIQLKAKNIITFNETISAENTAFLFNNFKPDLIYLDPARRSNTGKKVFRIADCEPNLLLLKDKLFEYTNEILVKLSPMADTSKISEELGKEVREIHIIGSKGECKELLVRLSKERQDDPIIKVYDNGASITFSQKEENVAEANFIENDIDIVGKYLLEPGKALMKSGFFNGLSARYGLQKFDISTHLYVCCDLPKEIIKLCKIFIIKKITKLNKNSIKELSNSIKEAEVTSKNIPMTSNEFRKKLKVKSGGKFHIFGIKTKSMGNMIIVAEKIVS